MNSTPEVVVVGVDFSHGSDRAADWAADEADRRNARLLLVHGEPLRQVLGGDAAWSLSQESERRIEDAATSALDGLASRLRTTHPALEIETRVSDDYPGAALVAEDRPGAILVVGSQGRSAIGRMFVGSVGLHVVHQATCPVVVVRGSEIVHQGPVVVGVDGSPASAEAVGFAFEEAALRGVPLRAVLAWNPREVFTYGGWAVIGPPVEDLQRDALRSLDEALAGWSEKFPEVEVHRSAPAAHPTQALAAATSRAQLLVVGSHGRHGLPRVVLGSVSSAVVLHADCPVAVVRPAVTR